MTERGNDLRAVLAEALKLSGDERVGERDWESVKHYYLADADVALRTITAHLAEHGALLDEGGRMVVAHGPPGGVVVLVPLDAKEET